MTAPMDAPLPMVLNTQDLDALAYVVSHHVKAARPGIRRTVRRHLAQVARAHVLTDADQIALRSHIGPVN